MFLLITFIKKTPTNDKIGFM